MHIFISAPNEKKDKVKIQCSPTDNIEELRDLIAQEFGHTEFPPNRQRLLFGGKQVISSKKNVTFAISNISNY
jgi:hypothetical protein